VFAKQIWFDREWDCLVGVTDASSILEFVEGLIHRLLFLLLDISWLKCCLSDLLLSLLKICAFLFFFFFDNQQILLTKEQKLQTNNKGTETIN